MTALIRALLGAVAAVTLMLTLTATPAHADNPSLDKRWNKCIDLGNGGTACMEVYGHYLGGVGITINHVYIELFGKDFIWEAKAADCDNVRMWNQNDVVKWRKDGAECDIYKSDMEDLYTPSVEAPGATSLTVGWTFTPKFDLAPDGGARHISITL